MEHKVKTLVILTPAFPKDEGDTTWVPPQQQFVKALKDTCPGLRIIVLTFQYPHTAGEYLWNGIQVIAFGGQGRGRLHKLLMRLQLWRQLKKLNRQHHIIGLLSFWLNECAFIGHHFGKRNKIKHYSWLLGQDAKPGNKYVRRIKPQGHELIALSDFIVREYHENYKVKPQHIIPVGITPELFKPAPAMRDLDILGVGSLIPLKQFEILVELVSRLKPFIPGIKAMICGCGPEMERLTAHIEKLNLQGNLILAGETPHAEVLGLMQRSKVLVHPSAYEGFGMVCLEALYAGAQVVSFVKPMDAAIPNWHIAFDRNMMLQRVKKILQEQPVDHQPMMPYPITDNVNAMMKLYHYSEDAI